MSFFVIVLIEVGLLETKRHVTSAQNLRYRLTMLACMVIYRGETHRTKLPVMCSANCVYSTDSYVTMMLVILIIPPPIRLFYFRVNTDQELNPQHHYTYVSLQQS